MIHLLQSKWSVLSGPLDDMMNSLRVADLRKVVNACKFKNRRHTVKKAAYDEPV